MEAFVEKLTSQIINLVPLLIIGNVDTQRIYLMVIPLILSSFIPFVIGYIKSLVTPKPKDDIVLPRCSLVIFKSWENNNSFEILQQYLNDDLKTKETSLNISTELHMLQKNATESRFIFDSDVSIRKWHRIKYNKTEIWYMFAPLDIDKVEQKDIKTTMSLLNKSKFCNIVLRHDDKQVLENFVYYVINKHHEEETKSGIASEIMIYTGSTEKYRLSTKKNFGNVFCVFTDQIKTTVNEFFKSKDQYEKYGIPYKLSFLFYGLPGTGKSSIIYAMAHEYNRRLVFIRLLSIAGLQTRFASGNTFDFTMPTIIVFEEIDLLIQKSGNNGSSEYHIDNDILSSLLFMMDGYTYFHDTILIFTTNHIERLPANLIRAGRMDHHFKFDYALPQQIIDMFKCYFNTDVDVEFAEPVYITTGDLINHYFLTNLKTMQKCIDELRHKNIVVTVKKNN